MKSIIQEASSIAKAIEEGWTKAQKPQQFSVKILEEAERNFLGLTKKSAKVAIFFDEPQVTKPADYKTNSYVPKQPHTIQQRPAQQRQQRPAQQYAPRQNQPQHPTQHIVDKEITTAAHTKKQFEPLWNQAMIERVEQWMHEALKNSHNEQIQFGVEAQKFHLRITLSKPILSDPDKEKQLLASFSALILETLKRSFKLSLRGHKIVLTHKK